MPTLNWEDVVEVSIDDARQSIVEQLQAAGFKATSWQEFSVPLALVEIGALLWNRGSQIAVFFKTSVFSPTSSGESLTRLTASHYAREREPAIEAQRMVTLTCEAGEGPHNVGVGEIVITDDEDHTFRNVEGGDVTYPLVIASGATTDRLLFEAEEAGEAWNVADNTVTTLVTTFSGVTVETDETERDGVDEESDERVQERNETQWALLTGFELIDDAVKAIVLRASPSIAIAAVHSDNPRGAGTFDVYISGEVNTASEDDVDLAQTLIDRYVFGSSTVLVIAAEEVELDLVGTVYFVPSVGETAARQAVEDALDEYLITIPLGGFDYSPGPDDAIPKEDIEDIIKSAQASGADCVRALDLDPFTAVDAEGNFPVGNFRKVVRGNWAGLTFTPVTGRDA